MDQAANTSAKSIVDTMNAMLTQLQLQQEEIMALRKETATRQHTPTALPSFIKPVQPEVYRGDRSAPAIEAWINTLEKYLRLGSMTDDQCILFASTLFHDSAATWWRHVETAKDPLTGRSIMPTTWKEFTTLFRREFLPDNAGRLARKRLQALQQTRSIREYIVAFRDIMLELPDMRDDDATHFFIQGLRQDARLQVLLRQPQNLAMAYNLAEAYESAFDCARGVRDLPPTVEQPVPFDEDTPMELSAIHHNSQRGRGPHYQDRRRGPGCYNCGGQGHMSAECSSPSFRQESRSRNTSYNRNLKDQARGK